MAYKTFVNGLPLTASELNEYLMNQSIAVFADATARDAAILSPVNGQFAYLTGAASLVKYNGTAWVDAIAPGATLTEKTADYTITADDANTTIVMNSSSQETITVADVLTSGQRIDFIQKGTGQILFDPSAGVNLYSAGSDYLSAEQYSGATIICDGTDYYLIGNLAS